LQFLASSRVTFEFKNKGRSKTFSASLGLFMLIQAVEIQQFKSHLNSEQQIFSQIVKYINLKNLPSLEILQKSNVLKTNQLSLDLERFFDKTGTCDLDLVIRKNNKNQQKIVVENVLDDFNFQSNNESETIFNEKNSQF
jgi:hypothetical protein